MSVWIVVAALLALAVLHSVLGERLLLVPLFAALERIREPLNPRDAPEDQGCGVGPTRIGRALARRTLRFAWHLTSVAWVAIAAMVLRGDARDQSIVGAMMAVSAVIALVGGRGQHFAWALFTVGALGALVAPRAEVFATAASALGAVVFAAVSAVHFAWASGARWGLRAALPEVEGAPAFVPSRAMTVAVAAVFASASAVFALAMRGGAAWVRWLCVAGAIVCALRALGDFRWVGLSKRSRDTLFARWDDALFTPLCVGLSACFAIAAAGAP